MVGPLRGVSAIARAGASGRGVAACSALLALLALGALTAPDGRAASYAAIPGGPGTATRFAVTYAGSGANRTVYHSVPPNVGGMHDTNDAADSSTQRWSLRFSQTIEIPPCSSAARPACGPPEGLSGATGVATAVGRIEHRHRDGLFAYDDASVSCRVHSRSRSEPSASIALAYAAGGTSVYVTAASPVARTLLLLAPACPGVGDGIDGIFDDYFTPGFSFAPGYGPERWFTSAAVAIPLSVLRTSAKVRVSLAGAPAGRPPRDCAVRHRGYERCATGGSWSGVLTFRALPG